jgi:hypothetical protein
MSTVTYPFDHYKNCDKTMDIALAVSRGKIKDPTGGALHYSSLARNSQLLKYSRLRN